MIAADSLGKRFGDRWLFRGLEFRLGRADVLLVTGANGSGKSTLLRIIAGLSAASEGSTACEGEVGLAAIEMALYPNLTISEHLTFFSDLRGVGADPEFWLGQTGLHEARDRLASQISTGMKARVRLALACLHRPAILLLDEPTAGLDEGGLALVSGLIQAQRERGVTILATNDPNDRRFATHELAL